ncbi:eCIS core domain-containing protein [Pseudomonas shirazensis]
MRPALLLWLSLALALARPAAAADTCPAGQYQVCLMGCFCTPFDPGQAGQILQDVEHMASSGLVFALQQAQADATALGTEPMPLHIRVQLDAWYDFAVLDAVRYRVGDQQQVSAANALLQNPDVNAVTLIDTVIFRHASDAENNVALWAHELKHVQQYQELGVSEFARRYTRNYNELEAPAYAIEAEVADALRKKQSGQAH